MEEKKKRIVPIIISIIAVIIVVIGASYAWFTLTIEGTKTNTLRVGNLALTLDDESSVGIHDENALPMLDEDGETLDPYHFTLKNEGSVPSDYTIYLDDDALDEGEERIANSAVKYQLDKNGTKTKGLLSSIESETTRILDSGKIKGNSTNTYDLRLWLDENVTSEVSGQVFKGKIRIEAVQTLDVRNENIVAIYQYDASSCITGEEETCVEIKRSPKVYSSGTIVKYKVNDTEEKYFHVISDNGNTLTMQQRENTVNTTPWYDTGTTLGDNSKGPLTVLSALENATASWTNVNDQTYTMGSTTFKTNAFTGCAYDVSGVTCSENKYTLPERTGKARMMTAQEAGELGCTSSNKSCPNWMNNYLNDSTINGGTVNQSGGRYGNNFGYWTMSATSSYGTSAMHVNFRGNVTGDNYVSHNYYGARAVVVIDK